MSEAVFHKTGAVIKATAAAAITAGEVQRIAGQPALAIADVASGAIVEWCREAEVKGTFTAVAVAANAGDPVWFDASAGTFTIQPCVAAGDFLAGVLTAAMDASATSGYILLGAVNLAIPVHTWGNKTWETKTANYTVDAEDAGKAIFLVKDGGVITLPATVAGLEVIVVNGSADGGALISISPNANDKIMGPDIAGTDNKDQQNTKATADRWDYMRLIGDGADGWFIQDYKGTWTEEA